jgi:hypothetical protein
MSAPRETLPQRMVFANTIRAVAITGFVLGFVVLYYGIQGIRVFAFLGSFYLAVVLAIATFVTLYFLSKALWLLVKHGSLESSMNQVGEVVLNSLIGAGHIRTKPDKVSLEVTKQAVTGSVGCWLNGATPHECGLFLHTLQEILGPVENPSYLLARRKEYLGLNREDYHSVPAIISKKQQDAKHFARLWRQKVGPAKLVFTRTVEGRRILLRARGKSLAASFQAKCERVSCWK